MDEVCNYFNGVSYTWLEYYKKVVRLLFTMNEEKWQKRRIFYNLKKKFIISVRIVEATILKTKFSLGTQSNNAKGFPKMESKPRIFLNVVMFLESI